MRILLTGGSGDLGTALTPLLQATGHQVIILDPLKPQANPDNYVPGSILNSQALKQAAHGCDLVVHIAGWHGIHEGLKSPGAFQELNVEGTRCLTQLWAKDGFQDLIFISSSSVLKTDSLYGQTKRAAEALVSDTARDFDLKAITLRPRGFIPHWNVNVYSSFAEWARYFYTGAVHIDDVVQAVLLALKALPEMNSGEVPALMVDRLADFADADLSDWDSDGPGSTFARHFPQYLSPAQHFKLPIHQKPRYFDISSTQDFLAYQPGYGLRDMLEALDRQRS